MPQVKMPRRLDISNDSRQSEEIISEEKKCLQLALFTR
jgi:hypothetical protein